MSQLDELKTHIGPGNGSPFKIVSGAAGLAAAMSKPPKSLPAAFVFFGEEASAENTRSTGKVLQRQERNLSVVFVTENKSDAIGDAAGDEVEDIKTWLRGRLIGFRSLVAPQDEPITHVQGAIADFRDSRVWFEDVYSVPTYLEET